MEIPKLSIKQGSIIAIGGFIMATLGTLYYSRPVRYMGLLLAVIGLTTMGKRLYERVRERTKLKVSIGNRGI